MHFGIKAGKGIESSGFLTIRSSSGPGEGNPRPPYSISNRITLLKSTVYIRLLTMIALKKKKKKDFIVNRSLTTRVLEILFHLII